MSESLSQQLLRRTLIGGYRVADVEILLAQFRLLVSQLDAELKASRASLADSEAERRELGKRLDEALHREIEIAAAASGVRQAHADAERTLEERARTVLAAAEADAARIRAGADTELGQARNQVEELLRLRDTLAATMRGVIKEFETVTGRIESPAHLAQAPVALPQPVAAPAPPPVTEIRPAAATQDVFDRQIEVDAGPFTDFAALAAFERALGRLPKVEDVYIRRFEGDRATIDLTLEEPAALLDDMTERLPYRLDVRSAVADRISLTVSAA
jgi:hypothetical protein